ncbi:hypothetical protein [Sinorhizobium meliloti]|uniref:hypothetical protein n=1 Tax=Rhizobium meliloti TaxID=382 RepID=UPI000FDC5271|nr:hypothetical protein [Sinorhizobium meliloti]RVG88687.1 hypothetical protein CN219_03715 [Sinorhizobium meliloti]RVI39031.1 hypothetical protein CN197_02520 [Sinorhizobium meliloti]RVI46666.1 hypothetical protein CN196_09370 [Sinorhizobium meliloti]RVJ25668.1 hypothetical protein CN177_13410 [Sinorhizobium meliloti]RVK02253.1 hypothetical protein CN170_08720 [Sinorhizobium meliloti]
MMTVKHIDNSGEEFVYPTTHVNFIPAAIKPPASSVSASVWRYAEDGRAYEIDNGSVYVMNEHGRTVARYMLSANAPQ